MHERGKAAVLFNFYTPSTTKYNHGEKQWHLSKPKTFLSDTRDTL